MVISFTVVI